MFYERTRELPKMFSEYNIQKLKSIFTFYLFLSINDCFYWSAFFESGIYSFYNAKSEKVFVYIKEVIEYDNKYFMIFATSKKDLKDFKEHFFYKSFKGIYKSEERLVTKVKKAQYRQYEYECHISDNQALEYIKENYFVGCYKKYFSIWKKYYFNKKTLKVSTKERKVTTYKLINQAKRILEREQEREQERKYNLKYKQEKNTEYLTDTYSSFNDYDNYDYYKQ